MKTIYLIYVWPKSNIKAEASELQVIVSTIRKAYRMALNLGYSKPFSSFKEEIEKQNSVHFINKGVWDGEKNVAVKEHKIL